MVSACACTRRTKETDRHVLTWCRRTKKYGIGMCLRAEDKGNGSACAYAAPKDKGNGSACAYAALKNKGNGIGLCAHADEKEQELVCACALRKKST